MKFGLHSVVLEGKYSVQEALKHASEIGYDGYEIDVGTYDGTPLERSVMEWVGVGRPEDLIGGKGSMLKKWATEADLELPSICLGSMWKYNPASKSENEREHAERAIRTCIKGASMLGAKTILLPTSKPENLSSEEAQRNFINCLKDPLQEAEKNRVNLALENIRNITEFFRSVEDITHVLDKINSEFCGIYYDVGNAAWVGCDPAEEILKLGKRIAAIHVKDIKFEEGKELDISSIVEVGAGNMDFSKILDAIKEIRYDGYLILEVPALKGNADEVARKSLQELHRLGY